MSVGRCYPRIGVAAHERRKVDYRGGNRRVRVGGFASADAISFEDSSSEPPLGVHLTVIDGSADIQWRFRDRLLASPALREQYDRLKRRFHGGSMTDYRAAKATFVERVLSEPGRA